MFYLHFLIELINSKEYWRVAKNLVLLLKKGEIQAKIYFMKSLRKYQRKKKDRIF